MENGKWRIQVEVLEDFFDKTPCRRISASIIRSPFSIINVTVQSFGELGFVE